MSGRRPGVWVQVTLFVPDASGLRQSLGRLLKALGRQWGLRATDVREIKAPAAIASEDTPR